MTSKPSIPVTSRFTDHSGDTYLQYEFFCDGCGEGHLSKKVARPESVQDPFEVMFAEVQSAFRFCPPCQQWVCRDRCWEAIQCMCEACAHTQFKAAEDSAPPHAHQSYSSILGMVCSKCKMVVDSQASTCPECGHKL